MRPMLLAFSLFFSVSYLAAPSADACMNGVIMEQSEIVKNLRLAEKALEQGHNKKALRLLQADHYMSDSSKLLRRIRMVQAVARMRVGKTKGPERVFRNLLKKDKDNPYLRTRLAEALHQRLGEDAIEAWRIMNDLEARDLVPDAQGYVVLARLRKRNKDSAGYARAVMVCQRMAGQRAAICSS
jgi:predicted Zn-dependent protease